MYDVEMKLCLFEADAIADGWTLTPDDENIIAYSIVNLSSLLDEGKQEYPLLDSDDKHLNNGRTFIQLEALTEVQKIEKIQREKQEADMARKQRREQQAREGWYINYSNVDMLLL